MTRHRKAKLGAHQEAAVSPWASRPILAVGIMVLSGVAGLVCAWAFGRGFAPAAPLEVSSYGVIQTIRLPIGARTINDLTSFEVEMGGADDVGRVYVNNYLAISTENPNAILLFTPETDPEQKLMVQLSVKRNMPAPGRKEVIPLLRSGVNTIVFENENSIFGTCASSITLYANGKKLEGFPVNVPKGYYPERASLSAGAIDLFERNHLFGIDDILCARRIFAFEVG